jgi:hypothetical protein
MTVPDADHVTITQSAQRLSAALAVPVRHDPPPFTPREGRRRGRALALRIKRLARTRLALKSRLAARFKLARVARLNDLSRARRHLRRLEAIHRRLWLARHWPTISTILTVVLVAGLVWVGLVHGRAILDAVAQFAVSLSPAPVPPAPDFTPGGV